MQCGSIVLSLLLLATVCHAQFLTIGAGAGAALALGALGAGALGLGALAAGAALSRRGGR